MEDQTEQIADGQQQLRSMPSTETTDTTVYEDANEFQVAIRREEDGEVGEIRQGTIMSARLNMLSTMVGGGSLSLPLAFQKSGNALLGPLLLLLTAGITEFCFRVLVDAARTVTPVTLNDRRPSKDSYESVAAAAFGKTILRFCTVLVTLMCFFGIVGYAVLLRDMLEPITDAVFPNVHRGGRTPSLQDNVTMLTVVFAVTPLCTMQTLTALKKFGAASMCSVLILGVCIVYRSFQCTVGLSEYTSFNHAWTDGFRLFPDNWKDVLDVLPLYISCYVCHYNLMPVHNELRQPSGDRVRWWLRSTVWGSTLFYLALGVAGSAYGECSDGDFVQGNILLDFPEDDPLLLVGRMCLAVTITLAFPMLTIPARDILIRTVWKTRQVIPEDDAAAALREPLLQNDSSNQPPVDEEEAGQTTDEQEEAAEGQEAAVTTGNDISRSNVEQETSPAIEIVSSRSLGVRLLASVLVFWTGAAVASCVSSIDIVWDLLGSSLSILLSHLIPCGTFIVISRRKQRDEDGGRPLKDVLAAAVSWLLIFFFTPLMFVSTANAVYNTFFH